MSDTARQIARTTGRPLRVFRLQNLAGATFSIFTNESANSTSIYDVVYRLFRLPRWFADDFLLQSDERQEDGGDYLSDQEHLGEKEDGDVDSTDTRQRAKDPGSPALDLNAVETTQTTTSSQRSCAPPQQLLAGDGQTQSTVGDRLCTDYRFLFPRFQSLQQARSRLQTTLVEQEIICFESFRAGDFLDHTHHGEQGERFLRVALAARTEIRELAFSGLGLEPAASCSSSSAAYLAENKHDAKKIEALMATYEQACADFYDAECVQVLCRDSTYLFGMRMPQCLSKLNRLGLEFCRAFFFVEGVLYEHQDEMLMPSGSAGDEDEDNDKQHSAQAGRGPHPKNKIPHNWSMGMARLIGEHHFENVAIACLELADLSVGLRKMLEMQTYSWCEHLPELYLQVLKQRSHTARVATSAPSWCLPETVPSSSASLLQLRQSLPPASVVTSRGFHIAPVLQPEGDSPGFHFHPVLRSARTGPKADDQDLDHASDVKTAGRSLVFTKTGLLSLCPPLVTSFVADDDVLEGSGNSDAKKLHVVWNEVPHEVSRDIQLHVKQLLEVEEVAAEAARAEKAVGGRGSDSSQEHQLQLLWETLYDPDITPLALFLEVVTDEEAVVDWQFEDAVFEKHDEKAENQNSAKAEGIVDQRSGRGIGTRTSSGNIVDESNVAAARSAPAESAQERDKTEVSATANAIAADDVEKLFLSVRDEGMDCEDDDNFARKAAPGGTRYDTLLGELLDSENFHPRDPLMEEGQLFSENELEGLIADCVTVHKGLTGVLAGGNLDEEFRQAGSLDDSKKKPMAAPDIATDAAKASALVGAVGATTNARRETSRAFSALLPASCPVEITARNLTRSTDRDEVDHTSLLSSFSLNAANQMCPSALGIAIDQYVELSKADVRVPSELQKVLFSVARMRTVTEETSLDIRKKMRVQDDIKTDGGGSWISGKRRAILGDRRRTYLKIIETLVAERSDLDLALHLDSSQFFPMKYKGGYTLREFLRDEVFSSGKFAELRSVLERCPRFMNEFVAIHRSSDTCAPSAAASSSASIDADDASSTLNCLHQVQGGKPKYECSVGVSGAGVLDLEAVDVELQESLESTARSCFEGGGCDVN